MKFGVLGTGMVGTALADKLVSLGHEVMMGARSRNGQKAVAWAQKSGERASHGDFAEAAAFGEIVLLAVSGAAVLDAARQAGAQNLAAKTVIDVTNPLDFSKGMPPSLLPELSNTTSAAEEVQKVLPGAHVVKALNTMNCNLMVEPSRLPGEHDVFVCGNETSAKQSVTGLLKSFGWTSIVDLGDLSAARGTEALMLFWLRMWGVAGSPDFNYHMVRA